MQWRLYVTGKCSSTNQKVSTHLFKTFAIPKSPSLTIPWRVRNIFWDFMSRCKIFLSCICFTARHVCTNQSMIWSIDAIRFNRHMNQIMGKHKTCVKTFCRQVMSSNYWSDYQILLKRNTYSEQYTIGRHGLFIPVLLERELLFEHWFDCINLQHHSNPSQYTNCRFLVEYNEDSLYISRILW